MRLYSYSEQWKTLYSEEARKIKSVLGDLITDIQHIGSTAIPNMASKAIIDIAVMLPSLKKTKDLIKHLADIGYNYDEPASSSERYFFRKGDPIQYHLSLTEPRYSFWHRQILFRDYLINHPSVAKEYEGLKLKMSKKDPTGRKDYLNKKSPFVQKVLELAEKDLKSGI